jgi:hypothetical protein
MATGLGVEELERQQLEYDDSLNEALNDLICALGHNPNDFDKDGQECDFLNVIAKLTACASKSEPMRWISVDEALPEVEPGSRWSEPLVVVAGSGKWERARYNPVLKTWYENGWLMFPTHWMRIAPPEDAG